jgi:hypothetical protein
VSNVYERESNEFQPIVVVVDGVTLTAVTNLSFSVTDLVTRPTVWIAAELYGGAVGLWVVGMAAGTYQVWWKYVTGSETIIRRAGQLVIA